MTVDIPAKDGETLEEWKKRIKDKWEYNRKLVIFQDGNGNLITPTTTTSTTTTTTTTTLKPPVTSNASSVTSPVTVSNQTSATPKSGEVARADTQELVKIIGITCGALAAILIIAVVCIRLCRVSARKRRERVSVKRPLNVEPEEHIYAEIEPLNLPGASSDGPSGASGSGSSGVPLPSRKEKKRLRGVSSFRAFSTRIYKWFSSEHSDENQSAFYNRSQDSSVILSAPEPPRRNIVNGKAKREKGTGVKRYESQSRRPLLDGDSVISTTSSNLDPHVDSRDNVYNPLLRDEGRTSGPYDHLRLSKTNSGQIKDPESDQIPPQSPHDYFTLEKETASGNGDTPGTSFPMENIAEVDNEDSKSNDVIVDIEKALEESEISETPKNHDYFILEPTHATVESPSKSANISVKDKSAKKETDIDSETVASGVKGKSLDSEADIKTDATAVPSPSRTQGSGKSKPTPKPRGLGSPTREDTPTSLNSNESPKKKSELEKTPETSEDRPLNSYTTLGDTLGRNVTSKEVLNGKDEDYVITKLGDAPKPPTSSDNDIQVDDYLEPVTHKPDYVDVCPNPPPRTTSMAYSNESPNSSREPSVKSANVSPVHSVKKPNASPKRSVKSPTVSPKHSVATANVSPKHSVETDV